MVHLPGTRYMSDGPTALVHRYPAPAVHKGDRVHCHLRGVAIITSWTDAPIPRCGVPLSTSGRRGNPIVGLGGPC